MCYEIKLSLVVLHATLSWEYVNKQLKYSCENIASMLWWKSTFSWTLGEPYYSGYLEVLLMQLYHCLDHSRHTSFFYVLIIPCLLMYLCGIILKLLEEIHHIHYIHFPHDIVDSLSIAIFKKRLNLAWKHKQFVNKIDSLLPVNL